MWRGGGGGGGGAIDDFVLGSSIGLLKWWGIGVEGVSQTIWKSRYVYCDIISARSSLFPRRYVQYEYFS